MSPVLNGLNQIPWDYNETCMGTDYTSVGWGWKDLLILLQHLALANFGEDESLLL